MVQCQWCSRCEAAGTAGCSGESRQPSHPDAGARLPGKGALLRGGVADARCAGVQQLAVGAQLLIRGGARNAAGGDGLDGE